MGKRPPGRPRLRRKDNIREDTQRIGIDNSQKAMLGRNRWTQVVHATKTYVGL